MRRIILLLGAGCLMAAGFSAIWLAARPPIQPLLPPGATDIYVVDSGWWEWTLTYRAPEPAYAWYFTAARQLEASGWAPAERHTGGPLRERVTYTRRTPLGFVTLYEDVELAGDLYFVHARMRRWMSVPGWPDY
jgi:hypothetical protein